MLENIINEREFLRDENGGWEFLMQEPANIPEETSAIEEALNKSSLQDDLNHYKIFKDNKAKAELFDRVFETEQTAFYQEHKRFMNSKEKKNLRNQIIKLIDKGLLVVNKIGQIQMRKSNYTPPSKKKKR